MWQRLPQARVKAVAAIPISSSCTGFTVTQSHCYSLVAEFDGLEIGNRVLELSNNGQDAGALSVVTKAPIGEGQAAVSSYLRGEGSARRGKTSAACEGRCDHDTTIAATYAHCKLSTTARLNLEVLSQIVRRSAITKP